MALHITFVLPVEMRTEPAACGAIPTEKESGLS